MSNPKRTMAAVVATLLLCAGTATAASASTPRLLRGTTPNDFRVRPHQVLYTGDGTGWLRHIRWSGWSHVRARGHAVDRVVGADGRVHRWRATVKATRLRHGRFTRLTIVDHHDGRSTVDRRRLWNANTASQPNWVWV
jgi:hypothetical protein